MQTIHQPLRWEQLDDGNQARWAVFQPQSGETHFVNPLGRAILTYLETGPSDLDRLCAHVATTLEIDDPDALREAVERSLARFDELGLIGVNLDR